jgi:hypothetical protein
MQFGSEFKPCWFQPHKVKTEIPLLRFGFLHDAPHNQFHYKLDFILFYRSSFFNLMPFLQTSIATCRGRALSDRSHHLEKNLADSGSG